MRKWIFLFIILVSPFTSAWASYTPGKSREADLFQGALRLEAIDILRIRKAYFESLVRCYQNKCDGNEVVEFEDFKKSLPFMITSFRKALALSHIDAYTSTTQTGSFLKTFLWGSGPKSIQLPGSPLPPAIIYDDEKERSEIINGDLYRDRFEMETTWQTKQRLEYAPEDPFMSRFHDSFTQTSSEDAKQYYTMWFNEWLKRFTFLAYIPHLHPSNEEVVNAIVIVTKKMGEYIKDLPDPDKIEITRVLYFDGALEKVRARHPELQKYISKQLQDAPRDTFAFDDWLKDQVTIPAGLFATCGVMSLIVKKWSPYCSAFSLIYTATSIWKTMDDYQERTDDFIVGLSDYSRIQNAVWKIIYTAITTSLAIKGTIVSIAAIEARPSAMSIALKETTEKIRDRREWQKAIMEYTKRFTTGAVKTMPLQAALTAGKASSVYVIGNHLVRQNSTRDLVTESKERDGFFVSYATVLKEARKFNDQLR